MQNYEWYAKLAKPDWAPSANVFGPVWSVLYVLIFISFGYVLIEEAKDRIPFMVGLPFALNLVFNFIFTWLQFGLKNNYLATIDILFVVITLIWGMIAIYPYAKWVTYMQIPYLAWVLFALLLQVTITLMNWGK